ncbi:MAG TPA: hypothetical protein EYP14_14130 [Planctomycetaceae bacterium]|nr:hypothetical protein [Planctomycetaceae bacterium]
MDGPQPSSSGPKPFLGIHMKCCNVYIRAYRSQTRPAYVGWCPRCGARVEVPVVREGGTRNRFFCAE